MRSSSVSGFYIIAASDTNAPQVTKEACVSADKKRNGDKAEHELHHCCFYSCFYAYISFYFPSHSSSYDLYNRHDCTEITCHYHLNYNELSAAT